MPNLTILDKVLKPSNQRFITRFHNTEDLEDVLNIVRKGLDIGDREGVYTSSNRMAWNEKGPFQIEFKIPKYDYKNLERWNYNPSHPSQRKVSNYHEFLDNEERLHPKYGRMWDASSQKFYVVDGGGRSDIFKQSLKPEWINNVCDEYENECYSPEDFLNKYEF